MERQKGISYQAYEEMAAYYDEYVDKKPFNADFERPALLSLLPDVSGKQVLDVACSAGWYSSWLLHHGAQVTAMDFSPAMIARAKKRLGDEAMVIEADLNEPLDFLSSASFDIVLSSLTLHYIEDWTHVIKEFYRILIPSGFLVFSVHHPMMDFLHFKGNNNYFSRQLLEDEWTTHQGKVKVNFFRRPLKGILSPLLVGGFQLDLLDEPIPTEEFRRKKPEEYERLTKKPHFLCIRAQKR